MLHQFTFSVCFVCSFAVFVKWVLLHAYELWARGALPLLHDMTLGSCQKFFDMGLSLCYELKHCPFIVKNSSILDFCLPTPQLHSCNYKVSSFAVFGSVWLLILFHLSKFQNCMNLCVTELFRKCFNLDCYSSEPDRSVKALLIQSPSLWFLFWVGYWGDWFFTGIH